MIRKALLFTGFFFLYLTMFGKTWYVSPYGGGKPAGTVNHPYPTIQQAAKQAFAGDTVFVMEGIYHERVRITSYNVCYTKLLRDDLLCHRAFLHRMEKHTMFSQTW